MNGKDKVSKTEISWSLMHPTALDVAYMRKVIAQSAQYRVDSFEICAACHSLLGGLDGLALHEDYPEVNASLDKAAILANRQRLREILALAHEAGKPVYYWHREVTVWPAFLKVMPQLRDSNGEFDLLGSAFSKLLSDKIRNAFAAVPELDGLVLTLTEADFSAIHNSTPDIYPPAKVVEHIASIFAEELKRLNKRFILRSFGSIAQDYHDILAGAALAAKRYGFEVETKITPYDFNPFLPENPFLRKIPGLTLGAECDSLGEFLGAGYLPAENVENIFRYVRYGQKCGVDRFTIRLDRVGNDIFSTYPINLHTYMRAIEHPEWSLDEITGDYAAAHYPPACAGQLLELGRQGCELVKHLYYIDGHLIFHQFPPQADLKWLKAGGLFALFKNNVPLTLLEGIWSILSHKITPGRAAILTEKDLAVKLAEKGLAEVRKLGADLPESDHSRLKRLWSNAVVAALAVRAFVRCIAAYFDDMEALQEKPVALLREIARAEEELVPLLKDKKFLMSAKEFVDGMGHDVFTVAGDDLDQVYLKPILSLCHLLVDEYQAEYAARQEWGKVPGVLDLVIPGALTDDWRNGRYMHASHAAILDGRPSRIAGNQVFPNGFVEFRLHSGGKPCDLIIKGRSGSFSLECNGTMEKGAIIEHGSFQRRMTKADEIRVIIRKDKDQYPVIQSVALVQAKESA